MFKASYRCSVLPVVLLNLNKFLEQEEGGILYPNPFFPPVINADHRYSPAHFRPPSPQLFFKG